MSVTRVFIFLLSKLNILSYKTVVIVMDYVQKHQLRTGSKQVAVTLISVVVDVITFYYYNHHLVLIVINKFSTAFFQL